MIDRINACEANLLSLVKIVDDLQKEINALKVIVTQQGIGLGDVATRAEDINDRLCNMEALWRIR